jgi:hypothetical protein
MPFGRQQFRVMLRCSHCSELGMVIWEESGTNDRTRGSERSLIEVIGKFHAEAGRTHSGDPVIVCKVCDTIQPD